MLFDITALKKILSTHICCWMQTGMLSTFYITAILNIANVLSAAISVATKRDFQKEYPDAKPAFIAMVSPTGY